MAKRPGIDPRIETAPDEGSQAPSDVVRGRQAAALCLKAAEQAEDDATRKSLLRRAAELISPRPDGRWRTPLT